MPEFAVTVELERLNPEAAWGSFSSMDALGRRWQEILGIEHRHSYGTILGNYGVEQYWTATYKVVQDSIHSMVDRVAEAKKITPFICYADVAYIPDEKSQQMALVSMFHNMSGTVPISELVSYIDEYSELGKRVKHRKPVNVALLDSPTESWRTDFAKCDNILIYQTALTLLAHARYSEFVSYLKTKGDDVEGAASSWLFRVLGYPYPEEFDLSLPDDESIAVNVAEFTSSVLLKNYYDNKGYPCWGSA